MKDAVLIIGITSIAILNVQLSDEVNLLKENILSNKKSLTSVVAAMNAQTDINTKLSKQTAEIQYCLTGSPYELSNGWTK